MPATAHTMNHLALAISVAMLSPAVARSQTNYAPPASAAPAYAPPSSAPAYPTAPATGYPQPQPPLTQSTYPQAGRLPPHAGYPVAGQMPAAQGQLPGAMGPGQAHPYGSPVQYPPVASGGLNTEWAPASPTPNQLPGGAQMQPGQQPYAQQPYAAQPGFANQQPAPGGYSQPVSPGVPQQPTAPQQVNPYNIPSQQAGAMQQPIYRVAVTPSQPDPTAAAAATATPQPATQPATPANPAAPPTTQPKAQAAEHPLMPALRWAKEGLPHVQAIADYSCIVHKRERVDGQLGEHQAMFCKIRHRPFSVYMYFLSPPNLKGQECIYVEGQNGGNIQAHATGVKGIVGTVSLDPQGHLAMRGNRYPITEIGVQTLITRLIEVGEHDSNYGECDVQFLKAKISQRPSTCIQVVHPTPRRNFRFHIARIYVDDELNLPIRFESWDWPARQGGEPQLLEEYTYQNLKLNNGFTEADFDTENPKYGFR